MVWAVHHPRFFPATVDNALQTAQNGMRCPRPTACLPFLFLRTAGLGGTLLVKRGVIIPMWPLQQNLEKGWSPEVELLVYPRLHSSATLYEDDDQSPAYREGAFSRTLQSCETTENRVKPIIGGRGVGGLADARSVNENGEVRPKHSATASLPRGTNPAMQIHGIWRLLVGLIVAAGAATVLAAAGQPPASCWTAAVTFLCAAWWILEPIPIPATSMVPLAVFPLVGVMDHREAAASYGHPIVLMLIGAFMISMAMEKSGAHRRLAMMMVDAVGGRGGRRLVLGFMIATSLLSMWISNTASVLMMLPVALAALDQSGDRKALAVPLMLGLAYASHVGGLGTPIGTPPNMIFMAAYPEATGAQISFLDWMKFGVPMMLVLFPVVWWWLTRRLGPSRAIEVSRSGPWRAAERRVLIVFLMTALGWMTREAPLGGWSGLLGTPGVGDDTVALVAATVMFVMPDGRGGRILDWPTAVKIPWGLLLLVGGGVALGRAFESSGLSDLIGQQLSGLSHWPPLFTVAVVCLAGSFLTEVMTNTATSVLLLPLMAAVAQAAGVEPILLMLPATFSCSCSFMLPPAAVPNAVVYGSGLVTTAEMAREGLFLKLIATGLITLTTYALLYP